MERKFRVLTLGLTRWERKKLNHRVEYYLDGKKIQYKKKNNTAIVGLCEKKFSNKKSLYSLRIAMEVAINRKCSDYRLNCTKEICGVFGYRNFKEKIIDSREKILKLAVIELKLGR